MRVYGRIAVFLTFMISFIWFQISICHGSDVDFSGLRISIVGIGQGHSQFGEYSIIAIIPVFGFVAFFKTVHSRITRMVPWYLCLASIVGIVAIVRAKFF